jgi:hypothetical protein
MHGVGGMKMLKWGLEKQDEVVWAGLISLRTEASGKLL